MDRKPGDWYCPSCDHLNFGWRDSCQRCADPRRGSVFKGRSDDRDDYGSFSRGGGSYGFSSGYKSGRGGLGGDYGRNYGGGSDYRGSGGGDYGRNYGAAFGFGSSEVRPGDWFCPARSCDAHNFASRSSCFKCGAEKDEDVDFRGSYDSGRHGGYDLGGRDSRRSLGFGSSYNAGGGGGRSGWKSGDWICCRSGCNEHNFASRMECFRCQAPRESGTAV